MKALLIEVDFKTGKRAGGIHTKNNPNLMCHGWQDFDRDPGLEIRLVMDGNTQPYENIPGITILSGVAEINQAIDNVVPVQYKVTSEVMLAEHIRQRGIKLDDYAGKSEKEILIDLFNKGLVGIRKRPINKVKE